MGYWNYRVIQHEKDDEKWVSIHEVYYDDNGKLTGFVVDASDVYGDTFDKLKDNLERMKMAFEKPILTPADFSNLLENTDENENDIR